MLRYSASRKSGNYCILQKLISGSALKQLSQFTPRPLKTVHGGETENLTADEKISEIIFSLDADGNGSASPWELHDWMLWVEKRVHQHVVENQVSCCCSGC